MIWKANVIDLDEMIQSNFMMKTQFKKSTQRAYWCALFTEMCFGFFSLFLQYNQIDNHPKQKKKQKLPTGNDVYNIFSSMKSLWIVQNHLAFTNHLLQAFGSNQQIIVEFKCLLFFLSSLGIEQRRQNKALNDGKHHKWIKSKRKRNKQKKQSV